METLGNFFLAVERRDQASFTVLGDWDQEYSNTRLDGTKAISDQEDLLCWLNFFEANTTCAIDVPLSRIIPTRTRPITLAHCLKLGLSINTKSKL